MSIFLLKIENNISGIFDNIDLALNHVYSLFNCNLISIKDRVIICNYKINTSIVLFEYTVDLKYNITKRSNINYSNLSSDTLYEDDSSISSSFCLPNKNNTLISESISELISESISESLSESLSESEDSFIVEQRKKEMKDFMEKQNQLGQERINITHNINMLKINAEREKEKYNIYENDLNLYNKFKNIKLTNNNFIIPILFEEKYNLFKKLDETNNISFDSFNQYYKPEIIKTSYDDLFINNNSEISSESTSSYESNISETYSNTSNTNLLVATNNLVKN